MSTSINSQSFPKVGMDMFRSCRSDRNVLLIEETKKVTGDSKDKPSGITHPWSGVERAERSGGLHKRSTEAWGDGLSARGETP